MRFPSPGLARTHKTRNCSSFSMSSKSKIALGCYRSGYANSLALYRFSSASCSRYSSISLVAVLPLVCLLATSNYTKIATPNLNNNARNKNGERTYVDKQVTPLWNQVVCTVTRCARQAKVIPEFSRLTTLLDRSNVLRRSFVSLQKFVMCEGCISVRLFVAREYF